MRPFHWPNVSASLAAALLLACGPVTAQVPERIKLGLIGSATGPMAGSSLSPMIGVRMAVAEINRNGGILGKPVDVVQGDDQGNPAAAVAEAKRLVFSEKVHVMMGPNSSQLTLAVAPTLNEGRIASVSTSGSTELTPAIAPYHFSIIPPADAQARTMLGYAVAKLKAKSVAWIGDNGAQTKAALKTLLAEAPARGVTVTQTQEFEIGATDMTPQLLSLRRTRPDVLLSYTNTPGDQGHLAKSLREIGWDIPEVAGQSPTYLYAGALKIVPDAFKSLVSVGITALTHCPSDPIGQTEFAKIRAKMKAFEPARFELLSQTNVTWGYDGVYLLKAAIEGTRSVDGPMLARWIEQNAGRFNAVSGKLAATADNHFLFNGSGALSMVRNPHQPRSDGLIQRASC